MRSRQHQQDFERLLRKHLRFDVGERGPDCVDAEIAAALLEGTLTDEEHRRCEAHIARCSYCTALMGAAVRAIEQPYRHTRRTGWWEIPAAVSAAGVAAAALLYLKATGHQLPVPDFLSGLTGVRTRAPQVLALNEPAAPAAKAAPSNERGRHQHRQELWSAEALPKGAGKNDALQSGIAGGNPVASDSGAPVGAGTSAIAGSTVERSVAGAAIGGALGSAVGRDVEGRAIAQKESAQAGRRSDWPATGSGWKAVFWSADHTVEWAVGEKGAIAKFLPGAKWTAQRSGVDADLSAGSAPSDDVCWVAGADGVVLRTTDGEHWEKVDSPTTEDLTALRADSASSAIITASGGESFATTDGGVTWHPL